MSKLFKNKTNGERGEIMIEGMIVMVITMFILIWILGLGFLYYQRYVTTIVTNDAAVKIASTYNNPTSDIIMGYVTTEDISNRDLYRGFFVGSNSSDLHTVNKDRAQSYVKYILDRANFAGTVKDVDVELKMVSDSAVRRHIELTTVCEYNTPFGEIFEMFGMGRTAKYTVTASADYTDMADFVSTVNFGKSLTDGTFTSGTGFIDSLISMLNTLVEVYNHSHS